MRTRTFFSATVKRRCWDGKTTKRFDRSEDKISFCMIDNLLPANVPTANI